MGDTTQFPCRFPEDLVRRIDAARGKLSRNAWLRATAEAALGPSRREETVRPGVPSASASPQPSSRTCARGCVVPAATKMKRCIPHGLELT